MKLKNLFVAAGLGMALAAGQAAAVVSIQWYPGQTHFEDDNLDFHLDKDLNLKSGTGQGTFEVGDVFMSVFKLNNTFNFNNSLSSPITGGELTGVAGLEILSKTLLSTNPITGISTYEFDLGLYSGGGLNPILALGGLGPVSFGDQAVAAVWTDDASLSGYNPLGNPPNCSSLSDCIAKAGGNHLWEVDGIANGSWTVIGTDNTAVVASGGATTKFTFANFTLDILYNGTGQTLLPTVIGSGDILGGSGLANGAFGRSDFDFTKTTVVPEPGSLALLATGLFSLMGMTARRKNK